MSNNQVEFDISLNGDEFPAIVDFNDLGDDVEVTRVLFNVLDNFWAVLEPEHYGYIESQLVDHLKSEGESNKLDRQISALEDAL